jgi:hypothetical protein
MLLKGPKIDIKHTSFWFVVGLKYHEKFGSEFLAKHLTLLAIFYHAQERTMIAEGLLTRALDLTKDKDTHVFQRAFALKMYAHVLAKSQNRQSEVIRYQTEQREIEKGLAEW